MSKKHQAGYEEAKKQHAEGRSICDLVLAARELPISQYANGFFTFVTDVLADELTAKRAAR